MKPASGKRLFRGHASPRFESKRASAEIEGIISFTKNWSGVDIFFKFIYYYFARKLAVFI
ncbi:MAG: hypothetical protein A3J63_00045 [Candidatus Moranbacteria bacterium RIFCSPHIGHO2_02_FULL_40_12b]|nr:MAG: hypothetical protein A3J63_00045 [Candidatus Moranbacteria bacterium RIFCSPHIGHO2_02_FULL_40_12b]OGI22914.1 MAG: hypothetical protein A3E91_01240 [Candidatus Moranbacteria bacterium RIFCSPHIGHO2_12_FULL_40_10]